MLLCWWYVNGISGMDTYIESLEIVYIFYKDESNPKIYP